MTETTQAPSTLTNIGVTMFSVTDVDASIAWYAETLGFELRADVAFGEHGEHRWVEVAPPASGARLALCPPMGNAVGGGTIGVETPDVRGEHARLKALGGVDMPDELMHEPGAPLLFMLRDPDGNHLAIVEAPPGG